MTTNIPFPTLCIIGPGLIGGSLALAIAERSAFERLVIWDQDDSSFSTIRNQMGSLSSECLQALELTTDLRKAVSKADAVFLCTPTASMAVLARQFVDYLASPRVVVTDVGSVKGSVLADLSTVLLPENAPPRAILIGGHPMAGSERSGFAASRSNLFQGARVVLVRVDKTENPFAIEALERLTIFWRLLGSEVIYLTAAQHDHLVATISHTPHLLSAVISNSIAGPDRTLLQNLAAGGFRDMTRISQGNPNLWTDILFANRTSVLKSLAEVRLLLDEATQALEMQDRLTILQFLRSAESISKAFHAPSVVKVENS